MANDAHLGDYVQYAMEGIRHIIDTFGPRSPGSPGERLGQEYARKELAAFCDEVSTEEFTVHPKAFMSFLPVAGVCLLAAVGAYWFAPVAGFCLALAAGVVTICQFLLYRELLDPIFPARPSCNVIAVRRASGVVKRRVILSGHMDAAFEWPYNYYGGAWLVKTVLIGSVVMAVLTLLVTLAAALAQSLSPGVPAGLWRTLGLVPCAGVPFFLAMVFFTNFRVVAPGANDNLSGTLVAMAAVKYLQDTNTRFENTEVWCISMGSEEAGLRGAKACAARRAEKLRNPETIFLAMETFRDIEHLAVYNRDMSGMVRHDARVCDLLRRAGENCGFKLPYETVYAGATDGAAFTQAGIPSGALAAMDPAPPRYYHTRLDHWNNMDPKCVEAALRIGIEAVHLYDREGLRKQQ